MVSNNYFFTKFRFRPIAFLLVSIGSFAIHSCKDPEVVKPIDEVPSERWDTVTNFSGLIVPETGVINFKVAYEFDGNPIVFNTKNYINAANDTFNIREVKHYFSNVSLTNSAGKIINLKNYHLMDASNPNTTTISIPNVPPGNYKSMSILLGVDSVRNHSGLQEGALDPAWSMFWTWSTGYIFFRVNGITTRGESYTFDIGGDQHAPYNLLDLNTYKIKSKSPTFNLGLNINEMFQNPEVYNFKLDGLTIHSDTDPGVDKMGRNMKDLLKINSLNP